MAQRLTPAQFAAAYAKYAVRNEAQTGVPALVTLAQAAGESGWAASRPGNMMFGIKADPSWRGRKQLLWTTEVYNGVTHTVQEWFRAYPSLQDSFLDHSKFLMENGRYRPAFAYKRQPYEFMARVAAAGYATAPGYYGFISGIMRTLHPHLSAFKRANPFVGNESAIATAAGVAAVGVAAWLLWKD